MSNRLKKVLIILGSVVVVAAITFGIIMLTRNNKDNPNDPTSVVAETTNQGETGVSDETTVQGETQKQKETTKQEETTKQKGTEETTGTTETKPQSETTAPAKKDDPGRKDDPSKDITYNVKYAATNDWKNSGITFPKKSSFPSGSHISDLPLPNLANAVFGGWYYDAAKTKSALSTDSLTENTVVYADMVEVEQRKGTETPVFVTDRVPVTGVLNYTFGIKGYTKDCIESFIDVADKENVTYTVSGETVKPILKKGRTYKVTLKDDSKAGFVINGKVKNQSIKILNIITEKETVDNLKLTDITYISLSDVSNLKGKIFDGLFSIDVNGKTTNANKNEGSFNYSKGELKIGESIAIYEGLRPDKRNLSTLGTKDDKGIAYVTITGKNGNTYNFKTADSKDILFIPDVLPIPVNADTDGNAGNHSITINESVVNFSGSDYAKLGLNELTKVTEGDYIAFYSGAMNTGKIESYALITKVTKTGMKIVIEYKDVTRDELYAAMDIYSARNVDINLTDDELRALKASLEDQALSSGFIDEAAVYLTGLALETDGFKELSDDLDLDLESYDIKLTDGSQASKEDLMELCDKGNETCITEKSVRANIIPGSLKHFEDGVGIRVELVASFTAIAGGEKKENHIELNFEACFEEEILFDVNTWGGAIWDFAGIFPYIEDYELGASLDVGTFACIGITATAKTVAEKDPPFKFESFTKYPEEKAMLDIGKQITKLMEDKQVLFGEKLLDENGEEIERSTNGGGLADKYANFIEKANESWMKLVEEKIFYVEGSVDPTHILVFGVQMNFVVQVNLYVTIGITFETGEANRYLFSIRLFDMDCENDVVKLEEEHYNFDLYVFGTVGVKVGVEMEIAVGLFSLQMDSIGVTAEAGAYAQLWGYFYLHITKEGEKDTEFGVSGALLFEVGFYLEVKFKAQLFMSDDLKYEPTIYENDWPLFSIGEEKNVYDFVLETDDPILKLKLVGERQVVLPEDFFDMKTLNLKDGEEEEENYDSNQSKYGDPNEEKFKVEISNKNFTYYPNSNTIALVMPFGSSDHEVCEVSFIWKGCQASFNSEPIKRTIKIDWTDPGNARYITFNTVGGSYISGIHASSGTAVSLPKDPTKKGYIFDGWYKDSEYKDKFVMPDKMPNYGGSGGITVYAKWKPATDTPYKVKHYKQNLNGTYSLFETVSKKGTTDSTPYTDNLKNSYTGYTFKSATMNPIKPDGTASMNMYYALNEYEVAFGYGSLNDGSANTEKEIRKAKYGATIAVPKLSVPGYDFAGYEGLTTDENGCTVVTKAASYEAKWTVSKETPYTVIHYTKTVDGAGYDIYTSESREGETGTSVDITKLYLNDGNLIPKRTVANDKDATTATITADGKLMIKIYYDRKSYKLTYMNGDTTIGTPESHAWGSIISPAAGPSKMGYSFNGWYKDKACTKAFDFSKEVMPASDLTLYAGYKGADGIAYKVQYYKQNAAGSAYDFDHDETFYGTTDTTVTAEYPTIAHFVPDKTNANTVGSGKVLPDGSLCLKIYYNRAVIKYTLDVDGGTLPSGASEVMQYRYGQDIELPVPTKTDYVFTGWYIDEYKYTSKLALENGDVELKAGWLYKGINYSIEHYIMKFDGTYGDEPTYTDTNAAAEYGDTVTFSDIARYEVTNGIIFKRAVLDGEDATSITVKEPFVVKLYYERNKKNAYWWFGAIEPYNLEAFSGEFYYEQPLPVPDFKDRITGYTYKVTPSEDTIMPAIADDIYYNYEWIPNRYKVVLNPKGGTIEGNELPDELNYDFEYSLPNTVRKLGYTFKGWATEDGGYVRYEHRAKIKGLTAINNATVNLYAVWEPNTYQIEYVLNGGTINEGEEVETFVYSDDETRTFRLPIPVKADNIFKGWYLSDSEDSVHHYDEWPSKTAYDLKIYALWTPVDYTVTWANVDKADDWGTVGGASGTQIVPPTNPVKLSTPEFSYEFTGWYTAKTGGTKVTDFGTISESVTYYAHYNETTNKYLIKWNTNNGYCTSAEALELANNGTCIDGNAATYGDAIVAPDSVKDTKTEKLDYKLKGWYTKCTYDEEQNAYVITNESTPLSDGAIVTGEETYYAIWDISDSTYEVMWDYNSEPSVSFVSSAYTDGTAVSYGTKIVAPVLEWADDPALTHEFLGWADSPNGEVITDFGIMNSDKHYYARWSIVTRYYEVKYVPYSSETQTFRVAYDTPLSDVRYLEVKDLENTIGDFNGWYILKEGEAAAEYSSDYKVTSDLTIIADWDLNLYVCGNRINTMKPADYGDNFEMSQEELMIILKRPYDEFKMTDGTPVIDFETTLTDGSATLKILAKGNDDDRTYKLISSAVTGDSVSTIRVKGANLELMGDTVKSGDMYFTGSFEIVAEYLGTSSTAKTSAISITDGDFIANATRVYVISGGIDADNSKTANGIDITKLGSTKELGVKLLASEVFVHARSKCEGSAINATAYVGKGSIMHLVGHTATTKSIYSRVSYLTSDTGLNRDSFAKLQTPIDFYEDFLTYFLDVSKLKNCSSLNNGYADCNNDDYNQSVLKDV